MLADVAMPADAWCLVVPRTNACGGVQVYDAHSDVLWIGSYDKHVYGVHLQPQGGALRLLRQTASTA